MNKYLEELNRRLQIKDVSCLEEYAKTYDVPIIEYDSLMVLKALISTNKIKKILEIGTAIAYSSINMALVSNDIIIDTIERNENMYQEAIKNINKFELNSQIRVHLNDALEIDLDTLEKDYDLIFIDAAKAQSEKFFNRFSQLLSDKGIIVTDNLLFHGCVENSEGQSKNVRNMVKKIDAYNNYLVNLTEYNTVFIDTGDGLAITTRRK